MEFDEEWYLKRYPDVAVAVRARRHASGLQHYLAHGGREGRLAPPGFDAGISEARPVASGVAERSGPLVTPLQHEPGCSQRRFLERFRHYDPAVGLASVLDGLDEAQADPRVAYANVLGRWPSTYEYQCGSGNVAQTYTELLAGSEFRDSLIGSVLGAYPEKRRLLFVHIPKCAGTDLQAILSDHAAPLHRNVTSPGWTAQSALYGHLKGLVEHLSRSRNILVCGHNRLAWFIGQKFHRMGDRLFAVVREPVSRALSQINYVVAALVRDPSGSRPDTRRWLDILGRSETGSSNPKDLAMEILRVRPEIMGINVMCHFLGAGDLDSAIATLRSCNIELSDTDRYEEWLSTRWGVPRSRHANQSESLVRRSDLSEKDLECIRGASIDDVRLHERISMRLNTTGKPFVYGYDL